MKRLLTAIMAAWMATAGAVVMAEVQNNVPSCYAANKMDAPDGTDTAIFVLIDQTTPLNDQLHNQAEKNAYGYLMKHGGQFVVAAFSSFEQDHYMSILGAGVDEKPVPEGDRMSISVPKLQKLDACLKKQKAYAGKMAVSLMDKAITGASDQLGKSDILASLKEFSAVVRHSKAAHKVVFVVSDMLENSSISSFYASNSVRQVNPEAELKKAVDNGMIGDFGGAVIYVMGAGIVSEAGAKNGIYRDPKTLHALSAFWKSYFDKSQASVAEFGMPAMLRTIE